MRLRPVGWRAAAAASRPVGGDRAEGIDRIRAHSTHST